MANNKVQLADGTVLMDISDTTAEAGDVVEGMKFYLANGEKGVGALRIGNTRVWYGSCSTAAATQVKAVTIEGVTALVAGDVFVITFTAQQNYNGAPTLNINSLGAKNIRRLTGTNAARYEWSAGETVILVWNGTYFLILNGGFATTTYYGRTKLANSAISTNTATALVPAALNNLAQNMISGAPIYSASETYDVGDRVRYGTQTWECVTAIPTAEAWNAEHWAALPALQTQIDNILNIIFPVGTIYTTASATPPTFGSSWTWEEIILPMTWNDLKTGSRTSYAGTGTGSVHYWKRIA